MRACPGVQRPVLRYVVASFLLGRSALLAVIAFSRFVRPERTPNPDKDFVAFPTHPLWDSLCRWDSGWYDRIARLGYFEARGGEVQSDVAFFPAFPYLSRWLGPLFGGHFAAGLVLSNLGLLGALYFLHELALRHAGPRGARRAVWLVLLFPATVFYSAYYSDGLYFFAVTGCFYFYEKRQYPPAGAFGALAAMTRPFGVLLLPALFLGALRDARWRPRVLPAGLAWLGLVLVGFGVVLLVLHDRVGDAFAFVHVERAWGRSPTLPFMTLYRALASVRQAGLIDGLDLAASLLLFPVAFFSRKKVDLAQALFALGCVALPLCSGRTRSMDRYAATIPAVFLVLAIATERRWARAVVFLGFGALMVVQTALFVGWYWAG